VSIREHRSLSVEESIMQVSAFAAREGFYIYSMKLDHEDYQEITPTLFKDENGLFIYGYNSKIYIQEQWK
jgi:hypothetical protein